jgi:hypothetical protein
VIVLSVHIRHQLEVALEVRLASARSKSGVVSRVAGKLDA